MFDLCKSKTQVAFYQNCVKTAGDHLSQIDSVCKLAEKRQMFYAWRLTGTEENHFNHTLGDCVKYNFHFHFFVFVFLKEQTEENYFNHTLNHALKSLLKMHSGEK